MPGQQQKKTEKPMLAFIISDFSDLLPSNNPVTALVSNLAKTGQDSGNAVP
jgi:hypothetical protein